MQHILFAFLLGLSTNKLIARRERGREDDIASTQFAEGVAEEIVQERRGWGRCWEEEGREDNLVVRKSKREDSLLKKRREGLLLLQSQQPNELPSAHASGIQKKGFHFTLFLHSISMELSGYVSVCNGLFDSGLVFFRRRNRKRE
jgi:hypothetical protein